MAGTYNLLSRAGLTFEYLHTNSTTHEFLFGALAELLDNARDANASRMDVYTEFDETVRGGYTLCFLDDGTGMDPNETASIVQFGRSSKRLPDGNLIGQYGNGLKSGTMRIGRDFILFTKKGDTMSCLFLSRTFHEQEKIEEVIVPMPSFDSITGSPLIGNSPAEKEKHRVEMDIILKYSPFHTEEELFRQFRQIQNTGTLVVVFHMKLLDNGDPELDVFSYETDILMGGMMPQDITYDNGIFPERYSFRAYTSILYAEPKMRVYIQGKKVDTRKLTYVMYKPRLYKYTSNRFKTRSENDSARALESAKLAQENAREAQSKYKELEIKYKNINTKDSRAKLRQAQAHSQDMKEEASYKQKVADAKQKALKEPKTLDFIFGVNINNRRQQGMFIYNCNRLVKMYEKVGPQQDGGVMCSGVVGYVNIPYIVLEPTHNKQDFADHKEYRLLLKALGDHILQYWKDINIVNQGVLKFWENYGYISSNWKDAPSPDPKYLRKRAMQLPIMIQCTACLKWRQLPFSASSIGIEYPENWECSMSKDSQANKCSIPEKKLSIPTGTLKREIKSAADKQKDLEEEIKRKQEKLEQMEKTKKLLKRRSPSPPPAPTPPRRIARAPAVKPSPKPVPKPSRKPSPPPPPKVIPKGKAKPIPKAPPKPEPKKQYTSKPVGKASPQVQQRAPSPKRSTAVAPTKRPSAAPTPTNRKSAKIIDDDEEEEEKSPKKKRRMSGSSQGSMESDDNKKSSQDSSEAETDSEGVGLKVETLIRGQWHKGTVVKVNKRSESGEKWRVKFEDHPQDKFDKWYEKESEDLRLQGSEDSMSTETAKSKENQKQTNNKTADKQKEKEEIAEEKQVESNKKEPVVKLTVAKKVEEIKKIEESKTKGKEEKDVKDRTVKKDENHVEDVSMDSGADEVLKGKGKKGDLAETSAAKEQVEKLTKLNESLCESFRTCLRYFLPPEWTMTKDDINGMDASKLTEFPLDNFFDHYEKGLRDLVGRYQVNAEEKEREAMTSQSKLSNLRKMVAQLLSTLHDTQDDLSIESMKGDEIDNLLAVCLKDQDTQE